MGRIRTVLALAMIALLTAPLVVATPPLPSTGYVMGFHHATYHKVQGAVGSLGSVYRSAPYAASVGGGYQAASVEVPVNVACAYGVVVGLRFLVPEDFDPGARVGLLDLATTSYKVLHVGVTEPGWIEIGLAGTTFHVPRVAAYTPGAWHALDARVADGFAEVSLDGLALGTFPLERVTLPTKITISTPGADESGVAIDDARVIPIANRLQDAFDWMSWQAWNDKYPWKVKLAAPARSAPTSLDIDPYGGHNPGNLGAYRALPLCALDRAVAYSVSGWFHVSDWGSAPYALLELYGSTTPNVDTSLFRVGDMNWDGLIDIEFQTGKNVGYTRAVERVSTLAPLRYDEWQHVEVTVRSSRTTLTAAELAEHTIFGLDPVVELAVDGESVGSWPMRRAAIPQIVYTGIYYSNDAVVGGHDVNLDDFEARVEFLAPLCDKIPAYIRTDTATLSFDSLWLDTRREIASLTLDAGLGVVDVTGTGLGTLTFPVDGRYDVWHNATTTDGLSVADTCPVVRDTVAPTLDLGRTRVEGTPGRGDWFVDAERWHLFSQISTYLAAEDERSGLDVVRYRVDGGENRTTSMVDYGYYGYALVLTGTGRHVVEWAPVDKAGNEGPWHTIAVNYDPWPPIASWTANGRSAGGWHNTETVDVTVLWNDDVSGVLATPRCDPTETWTLVDCPDGTTFTLDGERLHKVPYYVSDEAGNVAQGEYPIGIDLAPPASTLYAYGTAGQNGWSKSWVEVATAATDALSGVQARHYRVDDGPTKSFQYGNRVWIQNGTHTVTYWSTDRAGNVEAERSRTIKVDTVAPTTSAAVSVAPDSNGWTLAPFVDVDISVVEHTSGLQSLLWSLDGGPPTAYDGPVRIASDGPHTLSWTATDVAGNAEATKSLSLKLDTGAPTVGITPSHAPQGGWLRGGATVQVAAADAGSGVAELWTRNDGLAWLKTTASSRTFTPPAGDRTFEAYAVDAAGRVSEVASAAWKVDAAAPSLELTHPKPTTVHTPFGIFDGGFVRISWSVVAGVPVEFRGTAGDDESGLHAVRVLLNGKPVDVEGSETWRAEVDPLVGYNTVEVQVEDVAGFVTSKRWVLLGA